MCALKAMLVFILFLMALTAAQVEQSTVNVLCYYVNGYGVNIAPPDSLDPNLCTHIIYAFAILDIGGNLTVGRKSVDIDKGMYKKVLALKEKNPKLKVLISVGDTNASIFAEVAENPLKRQNFANTAVSFLETYGFDGIDIDWEKPTGLDSDNFVEMLKDLRSVLNQRDWLLTAAVFPYPSEGYNVTEIVKYVDAIHIMCYNFYGPWNTYTGFNSALFPAAIESNFEKTRLNIASSITNWINAGAPKEKINVGIPFYGRTLTLVDPNQHGVHAPILGGGKPNTPNYNMICLTFTNYTRVWDDEQKVPYKYFQNQWLSYEDEHSMAEKTKYIVSQNVAGIMIWQIGLDDVKGECGPKQGLLRAINNNLDTNKTNSAPS